jgi:D-alanine-D-alanine ligase
MDQKLKVTVLYDEAEDIEKAKADEQGKPFPLAYTQVADALTKRGHEVQPIAVSRKIRDLVSLIEKDSSDVIFNLCESIASSPRLEHNVVGLLELFEKCFTGCGSAGWLLAGDKALCKKILQFHGIRYPRFCAIEKGKVDWADNLDFPLIVKPINEDASIGIDKDSVVNNVKELLERASYLQQQFDSATLIEEYIEGREIYVAVIGNENPVAFPILEWDFSKISDGPKIAGSEAKWDRNSEAYKAPEIFPEDIPAEVVEGIQNAAITAYQALNLTGYARVDMRLRLREDAAGLGDETASNTSEGNQTPRTKVPADKGSASRTNHLRGGSHPASSDLNSWDYPIIEVNPNCWLEKRGEFATAARKRGLTYPDLIERILGLAVSRLPRAVV